MYPPLDLRFNPRQPRDPRGRWAHGGGAGSGTAKASASTAAGFVAAFEKAFKGSPYTAFVTHYTPEQITAGHMTPILSEGGKAGVLVHDHGDGRIEPTALFNASGNKGAGLALIRRAISEHGANYAECYGPVLPRLYATFGFTDAEVYPFDPAQAAPSWDYGRFDHPDYHMMRRQEPGTPARSAAEVPGLPLPEAEAAAAADDPVWWERYGEEAMAAARVAFGVDPPA